MTQYKRLNIYDNDNEDNQNDSNKFVLSNIDNFKYNLKLYKINVICIYFLLIIILIMQSIILNYFITIGSMIESVNISNINNYINKTKIIVNYVCDNLITC